MNKTHDFLEEILWTQWREQYTLFAILDCAQIEDESVVRSLLALNSHLRKPLFQNTPDEGLSSVEPFLLDVLHPSLPHLMPWLLAQEQTRPMVLWLASRQPLEPLQEHLRSLLRVDLPNAPHSLLRFYDPRVMKKMMTVLDPVQKASFFKAVGCWWFWDMPAGQRHAWAATQDMPQAATVLAFSEQQMQQFGQLDLADFAQSVQRDLLQNPAHFRHVQGLSAEALGQHIDAHIQTAMTHGLETEEAAKTYLHCVAGVLGWNFQQDGNHPGAMAILSREHSDEDTKLAQLQAYCAQHA